MKKFALVPIEQWQQEMKVIVEEPSSCTSAAANISFDNYVAAKKDDKKEEEMIDTRLKASDRLDSNDSNQTNGVDESLTDEDAKELSKNLSDADLDSKHSSNELDLASKDLSTDSIPDHTLTKQTNTVEENKHAKKYINPVIKNESTHISPFNIDARNKRKKSIKLSTGKKKTKIKKHTEIKEELEPELELEKKAEIREELEPKKNEVTSKSEKGRRGDRIRKPSKLKLESLETEKLWIQ